MLAYKLRINQSRCMCVRPCLFKWPRHQLCTNLPGPAACTRPPAFPLTLRSTVFSHRAMRDQRRNESFRSTSVPVPRV